MAGVPPKEFQFKPGQSGNPGGKPKGLLTAADVSALIGVLSVLTVEELKIRRDDPKGRTHERIIAGEIVAALEKQDYSRLEMLFSRGVGKVKDSVDVNNFKHDAALAAEPKENVITLLRQMRGAKEGTNG